MVGTKGAMLDRWQRISAKRTVQWRRLYIARYRQGSGFAKNGGRMRILFSRVERRIDGIADPSAHSTGRAELCKRRHRLRCLLSTTALFEPAKAGNPSTKTALFWFRDPVIMKFERSPGPDPTRQLPDSLQGCHILITLFAACSWLACLPCLCDRHTGQGARGRMTAA